MTVLHEQVRSSSQKKARWTTLIIIDFGCGAEYLQCGCVESKGFCFYKSTNGIKRHLAVDTLGFPFFTHCTKANVSDDAGLLFDVDAKYALFSVKTCQYSQDYYFVRSRLSPRPSDAGVRIGVSSVHAEN